MIQSICIHNFKCIGDLDLSLAFGEGKAPNRHQERPLIPFAQMGRARDGARICVALAMYGANASGKTTILKAVETLTLIIKQGVQSAFYTPNLVVPTEDKSISLGLTFWKGRDVFSYGLSFERDAITSESLTCNGNAVFSVRNGELEISFDEAPWLTAAVNIEFHLHCIDSITSKQVKTFIYEASMALPGISPILRTANSFFTDDIVFLTPGTDMVGGIESLANTYDPDLPAAERENMAAKAVVRYLHKLDFRIVGLELEDKWALASGAPRKLTSIHKTSNGGEVALPAAQESEGTQRIISCLGYLLAAIHKGQTVVIDELDCSMHSVILQLIVELFKSRRINANEDGCKAQLIFTAHNADLLSEKLLDMSDVGIVRQFDFEGTDVLRLCDIPRMKNTEDFKKRYLRGDFSGIPNAYV